MTLKYNPLLSGKLDQVGAGGRGACSAIVFIDGDLIVAEDNVGTIIKEDSNATTVIQAALDKIATHGSGKLVQLEGTYTWASAITYSASNLEWEGMGNVINDCSGIAGTAGALKIEGVITGTNSALTVNATKGQKDITVADASSFSAGDWIRIRSETIFNSGTQHFGELQKIASIAGNVITCEDVLASTYTTADTATVDLLTMYENIKLRHMSFIGNYGFSNWKGIVFRESSNVLIEDIKWIDSQCYPLIVFDIVGFEVKGSTFRDSDQTGLGYGVCIGDACRDVLVHHNKFYNCRHGIACGGSGDYGFQTNQVCDSNVFRYSTQGGGAFGSHNTYDGLVISNNTVMNDGLGYVDGLHSTIVGNSMYNDACYSGITVADDSKYTIIMGNMIIISNMDTGIAIRGSHVIISGNYIEGNGSAACIYGEQDGNDISITENTIRQTGSYNSIFFRTNAATAAVKNFLIAGNNIYSIGSGIKFEAYSHNLEHIIITDNRIDASNCGIEMSYQTGVGITKYIKISNNTLSNMADTGIVLYCADYSDVFDNSLDTITTYGILIRNADLGCHYYSVERNHIINTGTSILDQMGSPQFLCHNAGYVTENTVLSSTFAIDSTGVKTVTIAHGLAITPAKEDCHLTVIENTNVDDWRFDLLKVDSTDATNVTAKIHVSSASATGSATAKLALRVGKL